MMLVLKKLLHGLELIKQSVQLVITHPILLVYGAVMLASGMAGMMNMSFTPWYNIIYMCILLLINFFALACLCHHTMHILKQELHGFKNTLIDVSALMTGNLSLWFVVRFLVMLVWQQSHTAMTQSIFMASVVALLCVVVFCFYTALVLPILAIEKTSIIGAVKTSFAVVSAYFTLFLSIFLTLLIADVIGFFILPALMTVVEYVRFLTYTVFYYEYYAKPKPELADVFYPDM